MKTLISLALSILCFNSFGQVHGGKDIYAKLFDLYVFEKYEDCAYKAERMTTNDKYRRDAEPYLYLSMCYYKINFMDSADLDQVYRAPLKESLKYAYKYVKKDKKKELYPQNAEFLRDLQKSALLVIKSLAEKEQYRKAATEINRVIKIDPENDNLKFSKGVYDLMSRNTQGSLLIKSALPAIEKKYKDPDYKVDDITEPTLITAMLVYTDMLMTSGDKDSSKAIITIAKDIFQENEKIEEEYNILHNIKMKDKKTTGRPEEINGIKMIYESHESDGMNEEESDTTEPESGNDDDSEKENIKIEGSNMDGGPEMKSN